MAVSLILCDRSADMVAAWRAHFSDETGARITRENILTVGADTLVVPSNAFGFTDGGIDVVVTVRGRASHSSTPWAGVNAIDGARRVLDRVAMVDVGARRHPDLGQATLTATSMRSWPEATHTVQDEVRLVFDRRLLPGDDPQAAFAAIAEAAAIGDPWQVGAELGPFMHPAEIAPDGAFMRAARGGCRRMGLTPPPTFHSHGALDAGFFCRNVERVARVELRDGELLATVIPEQSELKSGLTRTTWQADNEATNVTYQAEFVPKFWVPSAIGRRYAERVLKASTLELFSNVEKRARER